MEEAAPSDDTGATRAGRWALLLICVIACALLVAAAILFYFGPGFTASFNSDAAVPALLADEVLRTGRPVPSTWFFGNDEIWTLAPHVFVMPFVATLGLSTLSLKLGNLLCLGVAVTFLTLCLHRVTRFWPFAILVAAGVFAPFSGLQEGAVYSQTAYGWFTAQFAILIYLALRIQDERGAEPWRLFRRVSWALALYVILLATFAIESPMRAAVYWVAPVVAVALLFPISKMRSRALATWTVVAFLAGALLHRVISQHVLSHAGLTVGLFRPIAEWPTNILRIWVGLPGVTGWVHAPYVSVPGALDRIRFCIMAVAALVAMTAPAGNGPGSAQCRFFARVSGAMLLAVCAALVVGRLNVDPASDRYLIPPALLSVAALMAILWCRFRANTWGIAAIASFFVVTFCGAAVMRSSLYGPVAFDRPCEAPAHICQLKNVLATTGIRQGYATYWKGNVTTLVSSGQVKVCAVFLQPRLAPFRWLTPKDCFDPPSEPRYFLALDRAEIASAGRDVLLSQAGTPDEVVNAGPYEVWIYTTASSNLGWLGKP